MRGIAYRRLQLDRAKARARRWLRLVNYGREWVTARVVGRHAADRVVCSCWMCGNARRHSGEVTRQELMADSPGRWSGLP